MSDPTKLVKLKNGSEEAQVLVTVIMFAINGLIESGNIAVYDLVMLSRDPDYDVFPPCLESLKAHSLLEMRGDKPVVRGSVKNIVLSSATGDGLDMVFGSPVAQETG